MKKRILLILLILAVIVAAVVIIFISSNPAKKSEGNPVEDQTSDVLSEESTSKDQNSDAISQESTLKENIAGTKADGFITISNESGAKEVEYLAKATYGDGSKVSFDCKVTPVQNSYMVRVYGSMSDEKYFEQKFQGSGGKVSFNMQSSEGVRIVITYYDDTDLSKNVATLSNFAINNPDYALMLDGGAWELAGHMQGATTDDEKNFMYMSFNDRLIKVDMHNGEIVASMTGLLGGHLGDITYYNGKVYGSLELKTVNQVYVVEIDVSQLTEMNMSYKTPGLMTAMYIYEHENNIKDDIFGARGIDGITFGRLPGDKSGKMYLIVACGLGTDEICVRNNYQILMAYDPADFKGASISIYGNLHKIGPKISKKFYVYTGYTWYGVQNLEYDADTGDYWICCYPGEKEGFPDYTVFVVNGNVAPKKKKLSVEYNPSNVDVYGEVLKLKEVGLYHEPTGIWGFQSIPCSGTTGFISLGNDYFYIGTIGTTLAGLQKGSAVLYRLDRQTYVFEKVE